MTSHHVLLLGGHGKVAQYLTPLLLQRSWTVTSIIRNRDHVHDLKKLGENKPGKLNVLVRSLEDVKSDSQAKSLIDEVNPDYVVWSAGAGGKGGPERTFAVDRDAAIHFINAAVATPSITKFLMVSYLISRRAKPSWWSDESWQLALDTNKNALPTYYQAKIAADEALHKAAKKRGSDFAAINLRPGTLTTEPAGKVELGKTKSSMGNASRESVAQVAALLLQTEGVKTSWLDLLDGEEDQAEAVERVVREGIDATEGEPFF
ncbi:NAD dependent epimerase/dehydratase, partial [Coniochaeta ligniaria NRRL 30616]